MESTASSNNNNNNNGPLGNLFSNSSVAIEISLVSPPPEVDGGGAGTGQKPYHNLRAKTMGGGNEKNHRFMLSSSGDNPLMTIDPASPVTNGVAPPPLTSIALSEQASPTISNANQASFPLPRPPQNRRGSNASGAQQLSPPHPSSTSTGGCNGNPSYLAEDGPPASLYPFMSPPQHSYTLREIVESPQLMGSRASHRFSAISGLDSATSNNNVVVVPPLLAVTTHGGAKAADSLSAGNVSDGTASFTAHPTTASLRAYDDGSPGHQQQLFSCEQHDIESSLQKSHSDQHSSGGTQLSPHMKGVDSREDLSGSSNSKQSSGHNFSPPPETALHPHLQQFCNPRLSGGGADDQHSLHYGNGTDDEYRNPTVLNYTQLNSTSSVHGRLFVGSLGGALTLGDTLPDVDIGAVVTCLINNNEHLDDILRSKGIHHHYFYVDDVPTIEERSKYSYDKPALMETIQFIDSHLQNGRNVFVHCEAGQTRSPGVICMYLITCKRWSYAQAVTAVQRERRCQLKSLEPYLRRAAQNLAFMDGVMSTSESHCGSPPSCSFTPMTLDLQLPGGLQFRDHHSVASSHIQHHHHHHRNSVNSLASFHIGAPPGGGSNNSFSRKPSLGLDSLQNSASAYPPNITLPSLAQRRSSLSPTSL